MTTSTIKIGDSAETDGVSASSEPNAVDRHLMSEMVQAYATSEVGSNSLLKAFETNGPAFRSLVGTDLPQNTEAAESHDRTFASDLNLDQILGSIVKGQEEQDLITALFHQGLRDPDTVHYRHEVFKDLEDPDLFKHVQQFSERMRQVRSHLSQVEKMEVHHQRQGWFLDAAALYCEAVSSLHDALEVGTLGSRGLLAFREFLTEYMASPAFTTLVDDTRDCRKVLEDIRYCIRIRGRRVDVSRYEGEGDYSSEVLATFERFKQGGVKDYRAVYRTWPAMNYVGSQILELVARLFSKEFSALDEYCRQHGYFLDETVRRFERGLQFYLTYMDYIAPLRTAGLIFCYPEVTTSAKDIWAIDTFDLALAKKLTAQRIPVVFNEFHLAGDERILVVSGPNQGGKTTFARTFGQLHHLASIGYPVPGTDARLFLCDRLLTHFEREEDLSRMRGQLEDDIARVREILQSATSDSIVIMNESFASTTLRDGFFLGQKVLQKVMALDLLCVYVTFIDELASLGPSVVSMVSTVVPENPAERTYKVVRAPADGLAYALAIAEKYNLTYERLRARIVS